MGFSQETLARALGITFQQIQKYERGTNRIFASRLFHLARVLRVPVSYFFQGMSPEGAEAAGTAALAVAVVVALGDLGRARVTRAAHGGRSDATRSAPIQRSVNTSSPSRGQRRPPYRLD
jgi:transcriptional regulator with XRE-family HTH domain